MVIDASIIYNYFPNLSDIQKDRFEKLGPLYTELNQNINVISRKDIESIYLHHVLHSLSIAKYINFTNGTYIVDVGTGGGFPGIPLAILFPEVRFYMIDGRSKKITVLQEVIEALGLENAVAGHKRPEEIKGEFDFILARAVTQLDKLIPQTFHLLSKHQQNAMPNGLIGLKGGDLQAEINSVAPHYKVENKDISDYFSEDYFAEKKILYVQG